MKTNPRQILRKALIAASAAALLTFSSCGGGDGPAPIPEPPNSAPTVTVSANPVAGEAPLTTKIVAIPYDADSNLSRVDLYVNSKLVRSGSRAVTLDTIFKEVLKIRFFYNILQSDSSDQTEI